MYRLLLTFAVFLFSCSSSNQLKVPIDVVEKNKDVALLLLLIQDHLKTEDDRSINLQELIGKDSLNRISQNFKSLQMKSYGGHISFYYQFSNTRNAAINLTSEENRRLQYLRWKMKKTKADYDGEIQFYYGERFYRMRQLIVKEE